MKQFDGIMTSVLLLMCASALIDMFVHHTYKSKAGEKKEPVFRIYWCTHKRLKWAIYIEAGRTVCWEQANKAI